MIIVEVGKDASINSPTPGIIFPIIINIKNIKEIKGKRNKDMKKMKKKWKKKRIEGLPWKKPKFGLKEIGEFSETKEEERSGLEKQIEEYKLKIKL